MDKREEQSSTPRGRTQGALILAMLSAGYALNLLDRQIINILAESIKRDLVISDAQFGLLTGTAFGLFDAVMGLPIGTALGFALGGVLDAQAGWRWALVVAAVPGLLLAILIKLFLREPRRGAADGLAEDALEQLPFWPTVRVLLATRSFLYAVVGGSSAIFVTYCL